ncbi:hypothetical protein D3C71_2045640 [compost metagenome]
MIEAHIRLRLGSQSQRTYKQARHITNIIMRTPRNRRTYNEILLPCILGKQSIVGCEENHEKRGSLLGGQTAKVCSKRLVRMEFIASS